MTDPIVIAWLTHCKLQKTMLDAIPQEALLDRPLSNGRTVGAMWAHIHNNRLSWLEPAAPDLLAGIEKIGKEQTNDKPRISAALAASGQAITALLERSIAEESLPGKVSKVPGFGGHPASFLGYLVAHEAYHHGEIGLALAQSGHPLDRKVSYSIWDWRGS
jgi:uncharacterized damage-inducible protein DinB